MARRSSGGTAVSPCPPRRLQPLRAHQAAPGEASCSEGVCTHEFLAELPALTTSQDNELQFINPRKVSKLIGSGTAAKKNPNQPTKQKNPKTNAGLLSPRSPRPPTLFFRRGATAPGPAARGCPARPAAPRQPRGQGLEPGGDSASDTPEVPHPGVCRGAAG